jgi:GTP-binding protein
MTNLVRNEKIRNIAIIAHVDHGKTTLVDWMFRQAGVFRVGQEVEDRVMDRLDLERERGITIAAKNCAVGWEGVKINIIDTPGHADFGGEVERALMMADGAVLLVDAAEGPLPQTRFVLKKALEGGLRTIVVINKIDRRDARPAQVLDEIYELYFDLDARDDQIDFPVLYAVGREGVARRSMDEAGAGDLRPLFETILEHVPGPAHDPGEPFQMLVADLDYSDYLGRLAIGRIRNGRVRRNDALVCIGEGGVETALKTTKLQVYDGVRLAETEGAEPGDIVILAGVEDVEIGDTICRREAGKALRRIYVDEPTVSMRFAVNTSPFSGREGRLVQSSRIGERLERETLRNVAIRVEVSETDDSYLVKGRGEFQLAILIETMRREGFELSVGRPHVIYREAGGRRLEPIEHLCVDTDEEFVGIVTEKLQRRKGRIVNMVNHGSGRVRVEFTVPSRSLIGYRGEFLTDTRGTGIMNSYLQGYEAHRGEFAVRTTGSIVADRMGEANAYALFNLDPRGVLFVRPGEPVYEGMIVGEHNREGDLNVNVCKAKRLTNIRGAPGTVENIVLSPPMEMTLERALAFIRDDELVEVTPKSVRMRKVVLSAAKRPR